MQRTCRVSVQGYALSLSCALAHGSLVLQREILMMVTWRSRLFDGNGIVSCRSYLEPFSTTMPNYFYTDVNGIQQGPLTSQQLQTLINRGTVEPTTPLTTDSGHQGLAGQIPGLNFDTAVPPSFARSPQYSPPRTSKPYAQQSGTSVGGSIVSWLTDFAFRDLRLPVINLWACRIIYAICCIAAVIALPIWILVAIVSLAEVPAALLIVVPFAVICCAVFVFAARLACEWYIIVFDWIVETTRAARKYNDE